MKLNSFEERMDVIADSTGHTHDTEAATLLPHSEAASRQAGPDSQQLRRIIREELQAARNSQVFASQESTTETDKPVIDEAEMRYQRDLVVEELEFLKQQDEVSSAEMERLMGDIAKLDPEARTELLKMYNRAINRGEIKGHL